VIEFDCEGCGVHVVDLGSVTAPTSRQCVTCEWLCKFIRDPVEFWAAYQRCMGERRAMLTDKDAAERSS
jgi:hypothetical protein